MLWLKYQCYEVRREVKDVGEIARLAKLKIFFGILDLLTRLLGNELNMKLIFYDAV